MDTYIYINASQIIYLNKKPQYYVYFDKLICSVRFLFFEAYNSFKLLLLSYY